MMKHKKRKTISSYLGRFTTLALLVAFVFIILFISIVASTGILYNLQKFGILSNEYDLVYSFIFMLLVSLGLGTIMAIVGGYIMTRPLKKFIHATKEIAAGNFNVRVAPLGSSEVQRLAESFNEMAKELGSVETLRNDFVSNISHEFKTPVVSIRGFAKLLKKKGIPEEKREEYLDIIISESERMAQLSGNVLLLSKLDSTNRLPETDIYALDEQLRRAILLMEPQFSKKNISLHVDFKPVSILGNDEILQHVWLNILNNALKFTPENGFIAVKIEQSGNDIAVTISDSGIGMDAQVKNHLFDKFYQADTSRSTEGNGLGLSLVKRIVDLMGGSIEVESARDEGTTFIVHLPKEMGR